LAIYSTFWLSKATNKVIFPVKALAGYKKMSDIQTWGKIFAAPRLEFQTGWAKELDRTYCPFHSHREFEIVYHHRGDGVTTIQDVQEKRAFPYAEGTVGIYAPNLMHDQRNPEKAIDVCVHFSLPQPWPASLCRYWSLAPPLSDYEREELFNLAQPHPALALAERYFYGYRLTTLLFHLLVISARRGAANFQSPEARYAEEARNYMRLNYMQIQDMGQVAKAVGISYDYLRHVFKAAYCVSLVGCLNKFRLERAKALLMHSRLPLKAVASLCGFHNERYFVTSFKKAVRLTPGAFRKSRNRERYR